MSNDQGDPFAPSKVQRPFYAKALATWQADETQAFERHRDLVCLCVDHVAETYNHALRVGSDEPLENPRTKAHQRFVNSLCEAQGYWFGTPISRFLDRPDGPVHLDEEPNNIQWRVSASCYHELAMGLACGVVLRIRAGHTAGWFRRSFSGAIVARTGSRLIASGERVAVRLGSIKGFVRSEAAAGIKRSQSQHNGHETNDATAVTAGDIANWPPFSTRTMAEKLRVNHGAFDAMIRRLCKAGSVTSTLDPSPSRRGPRIMYNVRDAAHAIAEYASKHRLTVD